MYIYISLLCCSFNTWWLIEGGEPYQRCIHVRCILTCFSVSLRCCCFLSSYLPHMYESFEPWHLRDDYKVKKVHAHSPPLSKKTDRQVARKHQNMFFFLASFLASRNDMTQAGVGMVYLANVLPSLTMKLTGPYWFHWVTYRRMVGRVVVTPSFLLEWQGGLRTLL